MKKLILSLAIVTIATLSANAQTDKSSSQLKVDIGVAGGIPSGSFGDSYSFGIGGYAKGSYNVAENIDLTLTADYKSFTGKTFTVAGQSFKAPSLGLFSALAGATYSMEGGFHIDAGLGLGAINNGGGTGFAYRAGVGYLINNMLDITANYNGVSKNGTLSYIGFGVGYRIVK